MKKNGYKDRILDKFIAEYLNVFGAVCIEGPKWCGKTWTSHAHCMSDISLSDPREGYGNRNLAKMNPSLVLEGDVPRLIDEWQEVPAIWDAVRYTVDERNAKGQFILTGSSTPVRDGFYHSGAGRIMCVRMRPMSLWESGDSSGLVSLKSICMGEEPVARLVDYVSLQKLIELIVRGGWPGGLDLPFEEAAKIPSGYLSAIFKNDFSRMDGIKRDVTKMKRLLKSLARNESTTVTNNTLIKDVRGRDENELSKDTVADYLDVFNRLFLTDNTPAFATGVRSSVRIKQMEKRHLADPSLACALLNVTPQSLLSDLHTLGFLFESLVERDLAVYAESFGGKLYHYQDYDNQEVDAVIELPDQRWCAFEIKLGANQEDEAAENLLKLKRKIAADEKGVPPSVLAVIVGHGNAIYRRPDGVCVFPITALKP